MDFIYVDHVLTNMSVGFGSLTLTTFLKRKKRAAATMMTRRIGPHELRQIRRSTDRDGYDGQRTATDMTVNGPRRIQRPTDHDEYGGQRTATDTYGQRTMTVNKLHSSSSSHKFAIIKNVVFIIFFNHRLPPKTWCMT